MLHSANILKWVPYFVFLFTFRVITAENSLITAGCPVFGLHGYPRPLKEFAGDKLLGWWSEYNLNLVPQRTLYIESTVRDSVYRVNEKNWVDVNQTFTGVSSGLLVQEEKNVGSFSFFPHESKDLKITYNVFSYDNNTVVMWKCDHDHEVDLNDFVILARDTAMHPNLMHQKREVHNLKTVFNMYEDRFRNPVVEQTQTNYGGIVYNYITVVVKRRNN